MPQYVSKIILNGVTQMDVTQDTVSASNLLSGETATGADGAPVTGSIASKSSSSVTVSGDTVTVPAGHYASQVTKSVASGTAGTPTATKGTVSNHSVSVTPSVTNTTGYITGSTKTGTAVTVSASELVSGTKTITDNGTGIDVTNYANVDVNVSGGGGGGSAEPNDVNFIDYDGTIVDSYSKADFLALNAMPSNPSHSGLTAQGWNWSLSDAKTYVTSYNKLDIGQMYVTQSGDTEIDITLIVGRLSPYLRVAVNGTAEIDWGDNSTTQTLTGSSLSSGIYVQHIYSLAGDYTIKIKAVSGSYSFYNTDVQYLLTKNGSTNSLNYVYANCVKAVRIGNSVTSLGQYSFYQCKSLSAITIPSTVTSIDRYAFTYCYSLPSVTIPTNVTSIGNYMFRYCYSLTSVSMPKGITSIGDYAFNSCFSLPSVAIPSSVTTINTYGFSSMHSLETLTVPNSVTSIGTYGLSTLQSLQSITLPSGITSLPQYCMYNDYSLISVTIPSTVTSIAAAAFSGDYGVGEYHFLSTTPPTLANTTAFNNIQSDCKIYVPSASLDTYKTTSNWSSYASYMVGE